MKTTSLELSKQLKEAGYPQKAFFHWQRCEEPFDNTWITIHTDFKEDSSLIAAPTSDEILDGFPDCIVTPTGGKYTLKIVLHLDGTNRQWEVHTEGLKYIDKKKEVGFYSKSLAEAVGLMWLYLKKENINNEELRKKIEEIVTKAYIDGRAMDDFHGGKYIPRLLDLIHQEQIKLIEEFEGIIGKMEKIDLSNFYPNRISPEDLKEKRNELRAELRAKLEDLKKRLLV